MTTVVEDLILDLVEWVGSKGRAYEETMEAWRTSCPRLPVWEDATERGFLEIVSADHGSLVRVTSAGLDFLKANRPRTYDEVFSSAGLTVRPSQEKAWTT